MSLRFANGLIEHRDVASSHEDCEGDRKAEALRVIFLLVVCLSSCVPATAQMSLVKSSASKPPASFELSVIEFQAIVADANDKWDVSEALQVYPRLNQIDGVLEVQEGGRRLNRPVTATNKTSRGQYVVLERLIGVGASAKTQVDVVSFDEDQNVYHRWRLGEDLGFTKLVGVCTSDTSVTRATDKLVSTTISWQEFPDAGNVGRRSGFGTEVLESGTSPVKGMHSWKYISMYGNAVSSRHSMEFSFQQSFTDWAEKVDVVPKQTASYQQSQSPESRWNTSGESAEQSRDSKAIDALQLDPVATDAGAESDAPLWRDIAEPADSREFRFEDLNFVLKSPGPRFVKFDPKLMGFPHAQLFLTQFGPTISVVAIVEKLPTNSLMNTEGLVKVAQQTLKASLPLATVSECVDVQHGGIQFSRFVAVFKAGGKSVSRCQMTAVHRGYAFQFLVCLEGDNKARAIHESVKVMSGFRQIVESDFHDAFVEDFHSRALGLWDRFHTKRAVAWTDNDLRSLAPEALRGATFADHDSVLIIPFDPSGLDVDSSVLTSVLMDTINVRYPDDVRTTAPYKQGSASGRRMTAVLDAGTLDERTVEIRLLKNADMTIVLAAYGGGTGVDVQRRLQKKLDLVSLMRPPSLAKRREIQPPTIGQPLLFNRVGLALHAKKEYQKASEFFAAASDLNPSDVAYCFNTASSLRDGGELEKALAFLKRRSSLVMSNMKLRAAEADLQRLAERPEEAIACYADLFRSGFKDESHLFSYLTALVDTEKNDEAVRVVEEFLESESAPSVDLRRWHQDTLFAAGRLDDSIAVARKLCEEFSDVVELKENYVNVLLESERYEETLDEVALQEANGVFTFKLKFFTGLAHLELRQYSLAKSAFEETLKLAPGHPTVLEFLAQTSALLGEGDNSAIKTPLELVAIPAVVQKQIDAMPKATAEMGYSARTLNSATGLYFRPGEQRRRTEYRTIKVLTQSGADDYKTIRCYFNPTVEDAFVNQLEVLDETDNVVATGQVADYFVSSVRESDMATTESTLSAPVPGLKPGYTLRYAYTVQSKSTCSEVPFEKKMFATVAPSGPQAYFVSGDVTNVRGFQEHGNFRMGRNSDALWWVLPSPPVLALESAIPSLERFIPNVWLGNASESWQGLGAEYLSRLTDCMVADSVARAQALELVKNSRNDSEKAMAVLEWVRSSLVYQGIEFGSRAQIPNTAERIIRNRYGDCKDHSLLAWQMLRAVNIPCHLAIVHTSATVRKALPAMNQFNHMIVYLPQFEGGRFVDLTSKNQDVRLTAASGLANTEALVLAPGAIHFRMIQADPRSQSRLASDRTVRLDQSRQNFFVTETLTAFGGAASSFRAFFRRTNSAGHKPAIQNMLAKDSRFRLESLEVFELDQFQKPFQIKLTYRINRAVVNAGSSYTGELPAIWEQYFFERSSTSERQNPFELTAPLVFESNIRFELPPGLAVDRSSLVTANRRTRWMTFAANGRAFNGVYNYSTRLVQQQGVFPKTDYRLFLETIDAALDTARGKLKLTTVSARTRR